MSSLRFPLCALFFLLLGLLLGYGGVKDVQTSYRIVTTYPTTQATITDVWWEDVGGHKNKRQVCAAEYRYRVNDITYRGTSDNFTGFDEPAIGDTIELYYNPRDPRDARLNMFMELWAFPVLVLLFGTLGALLVCAYCLRQWSKTGRKADAQRF